MRDEIALAGDRLVVVPEIPAEALEEGRWQRAMERFARVIDQNGSRVDAVHERPLRALGAQVEVHAEREAGVTRRIRRGTSLKEDIFKRIAAEDIVLYHAAKELLKLDRPTYMDVGAAYPVKGNNTYLLYTTGARGVLISIGRRNRSIQRYHHIAVLRKRAAALVARGRVTQDLLHLRLLDRGTYLAHILERSANACGRAGVAPPARSGGDFLAAVRFDRPGRGDPWFMLRRLVGLTALLTVAACARSGPSLQPASPPAPAPPFEREGPALAHAGRLTWRAHRSRERNPQA